MSALGHGIGRLGTVSLLCLLTTGCLVSSSPGAPPGPEDIGPPTPGKEVSIPMPKSKSYLRLWLPKEYTPRRRWPVIYCYHGWGVTAITWPFRQFTKEKGFVVVGMSYATRQWSVLLNFSKVDPEMAIFQETEEIVARHVNVNKDMVFMGGFSLGGYTTSILGERMLDRFAGLIIIGAGRVDHSAGPPPKDKIAGKPVFIAVGKKDWIHGGQAHKAAKTYRGFGADVTFEEWPTFGHDVNFKSKGMLDWFLSHSLLKNAQADLAKADKLRSAGKEGQAYATCVKVAHLWPDHEICEAAKKKADEMEAQAGRRFAAFETTRPRAPKMLAEIRRSYEGSCLGELAEARGLAMEGRLGRAHTAYLRLSRLRQSALTHSTAEKSAKAFEKQAEKLIGQARKAMEKRQVPKARKMLAEIQRTYEGSCLADLAAAEDLEMTGHLPEALSAYKKLAARGKLDPTGLAADEAAARIEKHANERLVAAREALRKSRFDEAGALLAEIQRDYAETRFARVAAKLLAELAKQKAATRPAPRPPSP